MGALGALGLCFVGFKKLAYRIRDVARRTDQANEMIRSRESFKIVNAALTGLEARLLGYDNLIKTWLEELQPALTELKRMDASLEYSASVFRRNWPDPADVDHLLDGLRKAGFE